MTKLHASDAKPECSEKTRKESVPTVE